MNKNGLQKLARILANRLYQQTVDEVTSRMHVHVKGEPRKEEIARLRNTAEYKEALEKALVENKEYQDCLHCSAEPDSYLVAEYSKMEKYYDMAADEDLRNFTRKAMGYWQDEADAYIARLSFEDLAAEVEGEAVGMCVKGIEDHLLNGKLKIRISTGHGWGFHREEYEDVTVDNYEEFLSAFEFLDESDLLSFAGVDYCDFLSDLLLSLILENHPELEQYDLWDYWDDELCDAGSVICESIIGEFSIDHVRSMVFNNVYLKEEFAAKKIMQSEMLDRIPDEMKDLFPGARRLKRRVTIHSGTTNSGKTFSSVERLKDAEKGIYLAPLRLLAYEQYQNLNNEGIPCSLLTGEERQAVLGAKIQSSTIEMADLRESYEIAVIDEAQMIADRDRGWAWVKAIMGLKATEIHVCVAPYAKDAVVRLVKECGDDYEVVVHDRETPLACEEQQFHLSKQNVRDNDAYIVFSRRMVHAVANELQSQGVQCSVIYGSLPYDVRQEEARRFRYGETQVVVATDAIGMGMNLPIHRIVFLDTEKFDGTCRRSLRPEEIQQIAGRAGRQSMFPEGFYNAVRNKKLIEKSMKMDIHPVDEVYIGFPEALLGIDGKLSSIISEWRTMKLPEGYLIGDLSHEYKLCLKLEKLTDNKDLIYKLASIPFDEEDPALLYIWNRAVISVLAGQVVQNQNLLISAPYDEIELAEAEELYRQYDLVYALLNRFGDEKDVETVLSYKHQLSGIIMRILKESKLPSRKCKFCGKKLPWDYPYGMCSKCHDLMYPSYNYRQSPLWEDGGDILDGVLR